MLERFFKALEGTGGPLEWVALLGQSAFWGAGGLLESVGSFELRQKRQQRS